MTVLGLERVQIGGARDHQPENVEIDRLLMEIVGAELDGAQRHFAALIAGGDDDLGFGRHAQNGFERGYAITGAVGIRS